MPGCRAGAATTREFAGATRTTNSADSFNAATIGTACEEASCARRASGNNHVIAIDRHCIDGGEVAARRVPIRFPTAPALSPQDKLAQLQVIQSEVVACTRCSELATTRTQTVFGVGNPSARLVFVGEAPGADEDAQGEPFVGRAGQLLTDIITKGMKLRREDVYILNVLKCRPPGNRTPAPNEVINCRGFLDRQLEIIRPEFLCCLGSVAAKAILNSELSIGRLRGKFHDYRGIPVLCTYHPAYLLRNPSAKKDVWDDIKVLMKRMGLA